MLRNHLAQEAFDADKDLQRVAGGLAGRGGQKMRQARTPAADHTRSGGQGAAKLVGEAVEHPGLQIAGATGAVRRGNGDEGVKELNKELLKIGRAHV